MTPFKGEDVRSKRSRRDNLFRLEKNVFQHQRGRQLGNDWLHHLKQLARLFFIFVFIVSSFSVLIFVLFFSVFLLLFVLFVASYIVHCFLALKIALCTDIAVLQNCQLDAYGSCDYGRSNLFDAVL